MSDKDKMAKYRTEIQQVSCHEFTIFSIAPLYHIQFLHLSSKNIQEQQVSSLHMFAVQAQRADRYVSSPFVLRLLPHMEAQDESRHFVTSVFGFDNDLVPPDSGSYA
jgi:hypothetical protein